MDELTTREQVEALLYMYRVAELHILRLLAQTAETADGTRAWHEAHRQQLHALMAEAEQALAMAQPTEQQLEAVLANGYAEGVAEATPPGAVPAEINAPAATATATEVATALTDARYTVLRTTVDAYRRINQQATVAQIASGANRATRLQAVLDDYARAGLTSFRDNANRKWGIDTYAEMALRTAVNRAQNNGRIAGYRAHGVDLVKTSQHKGSHPWCVPWQNKVLALDGEAGTRSVRNNLTGEDVAVHVAGTLDEAIAAGYHHVNCRHTDTAFTVWLGQEDDIETGEEEYKAEQRQRAIERHIREWKRREAAALTPQAQANAKAKIRRWQAEQRDHLTANPWLTRRYDREQQWLASSRTGLPSPPTI